MESTSCKEIWQETQCESCSSWSETQMMWITKSSLQDQSWISSRRFLSTATNLCQKRWSRGTSPTSRADFQDRFRPNRSTCRPRCCRHYFLIPSTKLSCQLKILTLTKTCKPCRVWASHKIQDLIKITPKISLDSNLIFILRIISNLSLISRRTSRVFQ